VGVAVLLLTGLLKPADLVVSARTQWRPLLALTCIMIMTGVVQEVGAFGRLAAWAEAHARRTSAARAFDLVFAAAVVTPSLLNNDAAIQLLTPLVVALTRRLYPCSLLPIGSLAGLLWMDLLRRAGVTISIGKFFRLGTLVLVPTLTLSLVMLWALAR
jgi:Na+/H+ antiporter NhaD/arsenite permease-like protein